MLDVPVGSRRLRFFGPPHGGAIGRLVHAESPGDFVRAAAAGMRIAADGWWRMVARCLMAALMVIQGAIMVNAQSPGLLALVQTIPLPDVRGRIDHMDIDIGGNRLFVAAFGHGTVEVVDLATGKTSMRLESLHGPQGVLYVPSTGRLFVADGQSGEVDVFGGTPLRPEARVTGLADADNLRYDATRAEIFVGTASALAGIDAVTARITSRIRLDDHADSFQLEASGKRIFVNVTGARHIAVIDRDKHVQVAAWKLGDMQANYPLALDEPNHRLYVATRRPAALLAYDTESGTRLGGAPIDADADDVFYDAERRRLYVVCGEGFIDVVQQHDGRRLERIERVRSAPGARTGLFVAADRSLYVAVPRRGNQPAEIRVYRVR